MSSILPESQSRLCWGSGTNRKTRWLTSGVDRMPRPPDDAEQHVQTVWRLIYGRTIVDGWHYLRERPKHDARWYLDFARALAGVYGLRHLAGCPECSDADWAWLLEAAAGSSLVVSLANVADLPKGALHGIADVYDVRDIEEGGPS